MQGVAEISYIGMDYKSNRPKITLIFEDYNILYEAEELKNKKLNIEIKKWYKKRSLDANAYLWVLIEKLAQKLNLSRIEVYKKHIYEAGKYQELQMSEEAMEEFSKIWSKNGLGWFCEKSINQYGEIILRAYYGSSSYDTKEMKRLVDNVIQDCKEQNIETMSCVELNSLLKSWVGTNRS